MRARVPRCCESRDGFPRLAHYGAFSVKKNVSPRHVTVIIYSVSRYKVLSSLCNGPRCYLAFLFPPRLAAVALCEIVDSLLGTVRAPSVSSSFGDPIFQPWKPIERRRSSNLAPPTTDPTLPRDAVSIERINAITIDISQSRRENEAICYQPFLKYLQGSLLFPANFQRDESDFAFSKRFMDKIR